MVETQQNSWNKVAGEISFSLEPNLNQLANLISKDAKILDYGCGYGRIANELLVRGYYHLIGVDTSIEMVKRGLKQYPALNLCHIDKHEIPIELGKFDVILFCAVLTSIPAKAYRTKIIETAYESLNEEGIIYCVEFHKSDAINYSPSGTFVTKFNVEMKHFLSSEISEELAIFNEISQFIAEATTLTGEKTKAIHYFGKKQVASMK